MEQSGINEIKFHTDNCKVLPSGRKEQMHKYELWNNSLNGVSKEKESGSAATENWVCVTQWQDKSDSWQS